VTLVSLTSACAGKEKKRMSAREGRDKLVEFVMNTTEQLDVTGWWPRNGVAWADECSLGGDVSGASYGYDRWAPEGSDHIADAKRVSDYWESLGMRVRTINPTTSPTVFAEGGPVLRASFATDMPENSYMVGAVMPCGPGDWEKLNDEDDAERANGVVLPGDEGLLSPEEAREYWEGPKPVPGADQIQEPPHEPDGP
jgi:hypothetical protein